MVFRPATSRRLRIKSAVVMQERNTRSRVVSMDPRPRSLQSSGVVSTTSLPLVLVLEEAESA